MEKKWQADIFNDLDDGKVVHIARTDKGTMLTILMPKHFVYPHSLLRCLLIHCTELELHLEDHHAPNRSVKGLSDLGIELGQAICSDHKIEVNCRVNNQDASLLIETESIELYDEHNQGLPFLELSKLNGLCQNGSGIDFYFMNSKKEIDIIDSHNEVDFDKHIKFNEELLDYLINQERYGPRYDQEPKMSVELLIELDPYGDKKFSPQEINQLEKICDRLLIVYNTGHLTDQKIIYFAEQLKAFCSEAIMNNKLIIAVGD